MSSKGVSILILQEADGWHVIASIDGAVAQKSPPLPDRETAMEKAKIVSNKFEAEFRHVGGHWRRDQ